MLRTSVCDRAGEGEKGPNILYCYYAHYIDLCTNKHARKFVTPHKKFRVALIWRKSRGDEVGFVLPVAKPFFMDALVYIVLYVTYVFDKKFLKKN